MAYTKSGNRICDHVTLGKGVCGKPANHELAAKTGPNLHYCAKHHKMELKKRF